MGLSRRIALVVGAATLATIGRDRYSLAMQGDGPWGRTLRALAGDSELSEIQNRMSYIRDQLDAERRSPESFKVYADDDLAGYGTDVLQTGDNHLPLEDQVRSIAMVDLYAILDRLPPSRVLEIGHGNGDVTAHLAAKYPTHSFIGIDFSAKSAQRYSLPNLEWRAGYALDELEAGRLDGDVLFAASTFCYVGPKEMLAYAKAVKSAGYKHIVISDMCSKVWRPDAYPRRSMYLHKGICGHDLRSIFGDAGFKTQRLDAITYDRHSKRAAIPMMIYVGGCQ